MIGHDDFQAVKQTFREAWDKTKPATEDFEQIHVTEIARDHFGYDIAFLPPNEFDKIVDRYQEAISQGKGLPSVPITKSPVPSYSAEKKDDVLEINFTGLILLALPAVPN